MELSKAISKALKKKGFSQAEAASAVTEELKNVNSKLTLTQSTLSRWAKGITVPKRIKDLVLQKLAVVLDQPPEYFIEIRNNMTLAERSEASRHSYKGPFEGLSEADYIESAEDYINQCESNVDLWFLGPNEIPVQRSEQLREHWISNLRNGVRYNFIWIFELVTRSTFATICDALNKVTKRVSGGGNLFTHYGVSLYKNPDAFTQARINQYRRLCEERVERNIFNEMIELRDENLRERLHLNTFSMGTILVYQPHGLRKPPVASLALRDIRDSPGDSTEHELFAWWGDRNGKELEEIVADYLKHFQHYSKLKRGDEYAK